VWAGSPSRSVSAAISASLGAALQLPEPETDEDRQASRSVKNAEADTARRRDVVWFSRRCLCCHFGRSFRRAVDSAGPARLVVELQARSTATASRGSRHKRHGKGSAEAHKAECKPRTALIFDLHDQRGSERRWRRQS